MSIDPKLVDIYKTNPQNKFYMEGLTIDHSALPQPLHLTNYRGGFQGKAINTDVDFEYVPFSVRLPDKTTDGNQALVIAMANDEQNLIDDLELMASQPYEAAKCFYHIYINGEVDAGGYHIQQLSPAMRFDISTVSVGGTEIAITASRENMHNRAWPKILYTPDLFPGIAG